LISINYATLSIIVTRFNPYVTQWVTFLTYTIINVVISEPFKIY
jgi:hypothetical protein